MLRLRTGRWLFFLLLLALAAGLLVAHQSWQGWLQANHVKSLDWQGLKLSLSGLTLDRFSVLQDRPGRRVKADGEGLVLAWDASWNQLQLNTLTLERLALEWHQTQETQELASGGSGFDPALPDLPPRWLPRQLSVGEFRAEVPCLAGRCTLDGALSFQRDKELFPITGELVLNHDGHRVRTRAGLETTLDGTLDGTVGENLTLSAALSIDGVEHLTAASRFRSERKGPMAHWSGEIEVAAIPEAEWLLDWIRQWQAVPDNPVSTQPETGSLNARWQLQAASRKNFINRASGDVTVRASVSQPWPIPAFATVQGDLELALQAKNGLWLAQTARADLQLSEPVDWVQQKLAPLKPETLRLQLSPAPAPPRPMTDRHLLPLNLVLTGRGASRIDIESHLALTTAAPWLLQLGQTRAKALLPEFKEGQWAFKDLSANLQFTGEINSHQLSLDFGKGSTLTLNRLESLDPESTRSMDGLTASLDNQRLTASYDLTGSHPWRGALKGPVELSVQRLTQPLLQPQPWRFLGQFAADRDHLSLNGELSSDARAVLNLDVDYAFSGTLKTSAEMRVEGEADSQALAKTLMIWPSLLTADKGALTVSASLQRPPGGKTDLQGQMVAEELGGLYDRTAWTGLTGTMDFRLTGERLDLRSDRLTLAQINPGVPIGPIMAEGRYQAPIDNLYAGTLVLDQVVAGFIGGEVRLGAGNWLLTDTPIRLPLQLQALQLSQLMSLYPTDGLAGTGILSGEVPVLIGPEGVRVDAGRVSATAPGGTLELPAERIRAISQNNEAMNLVAQAMENFHYTILDSTIDYDQEGTLILGLHIEGSNPEIRGGHPIELNINLEEDVPALLTSLQLSGRVNEAVTERVRELVRKREAGKESEDR